MLDPPSGAPSAPPVTPQPRGMQVTWGSEVSHPAPLVVRTRQGRIGGVNSPTRKSARSQFQAFRRRLHPGQTGRHPAGRVRDVAQGMSAEFIWARLVFMLESREACSHSCTD